MCLVNLFTLLAVIIINYWRVHMITRERAFANETDFLDLDSQLDRGKGFENSNVIY